MNTNTFITAIFIAIGFTGWPIIGKYSNMNSGLISIFVGVSTAVTVAIISARQLGGIGSMNIKPLAFLVVAGIINGIAFQLYSNKIADASVSTAAFMITVSILMSVVAPALSWLLNGTIPNNNQLIGFGFAIITVYFLSK